MTTPMLQGRELAMVKVLGAITYGEWKAHEGALADAASAEDELARRQLRRIAAEELRHHKGFARQITALGADPERAMRPYRSLLDAYHGQEHEDEIAEAVRGYLGEGIADDLLSWLRRVVDPETTAFVDTVIADEEGHEALATERLRALLDSEPRGRLRAGAAARGMLLGMATAGRSGAAPLGAFLQLGRAHELLATLIRGHVRRMRAIGLSTLGLPLPQAVLRRAPWS